MKSYINKKEECFVMEYKKILLFIMVAFFSIFSAYSYTDADVLFYYDFDNNDTLDQSAKGNDPVYIIGTTYNASGKLGGALEFDGTNDIVAFPDLNVATGLKNFSMSLWVKSGSASQDKGYFSFGNEYYFNFKDNTAQAVQYHDGSWRYVSSGTAISTTSYDFMVATYNTDFGTRLYKNGAEVGNLSVTGAFTSIGGAFDNSIGSYAGGFFVGSIDEVAVWNISLNDTEVSELYNNNTGLNPFGATTITFNNPVQDALYNTSQLLNVTASATTNLSYILNTGNDTSLCTNCLTSESVTLNFTEGLNTLTVFANTSGVVSNNSITFNYSTPYYSAVINSIQLSALTYLDLNADGTNYGETSDGFVASESHLYNITPIDDTTDQVLVLSRTELDGAFTVYVNGNSVGTSPAYAGGSGAYIYEAFVVSSAYLNAGVNEVNITASSGNSATIFIDYFGLGDLSNINNGIASNSSWVITYANITSSDGIDTVQRWIQNSTSSNIVLDTDVGNRVIKTYNYFYIYQLPNVNDVYTFRIKANSTTTPALTESGTTESVEIDSLKPVLNSVVLNLNSYVGEAETFTLNFTENNKNQILINIDGTNYSMVLNSSNGDEYIYKYNTTYLTPNTHNVTFYVSDLVGKSASYIVYVKTSQITQTNQNLNFNTIYNFSNYISVTDTYTSFNQYFKIPVLLNFYGNAYISDYYPSFDIIDTNPFNTSIELGDISKITFNNSLINLTWLTDVINNTATTNVSFYNYLRYNISNAVSVEWENSGVGDNRLFYIKSNNMTNNMSNITLSIPLRTAYNGNSSSIDVFVCTNSPNWALKTCNQWTEITSTLFNQNTLTYHAWGTSDYPTVDSNSDSTKDTLRFTVPLLTSSTGIMYKIESDSSNAEVSWSAPSTPETPASIGGGLSSTLLSSSTSENITNTTAVKSSTSPYISGFWEFIDVVFTWLGDLFGGAFDSLAPLFNGDPKNTILIILIAVMLVGIPLVSGGTTKKRGVSSA